MTSRVLWRSFWISLALCLSLVHAKLVNITIDDHQEPGAELIHYSPIRRWMQMQGQDCNPPVSMHCLGGSGSMNSTLAYNHTWTEVLVGEEPYPIEATVSFTGSAVYVYGMLHPYIPTNVSFFMDGHKVDEFQHRPHAVRSLFEPPKLPELKYNVLLYSNATLYHGKHTLTMKPGAGYAARKPISTFILDYIRYSVDDAADSQAALISESAQHPLHGYPI